MSEAEPVNSVDSGLPPSKKKKVFNDELYDEEIVPLTRRRKANKSKMVAESRFCITTSPEVNKYKRRIIPEATQRANKWAVSIFDKWIEFRKNSGLNVPPHDILSSSDTSILCEWLCCFFTEVWKTDGTPYCPRTISSLLAGLQHTYKLFLQILLTSKILRGITSCAVGLLKRTPSTGYRYRKSSSISYKH
jgi:hypothetical protein